MTDRTSSDAGRAHCAVGFISHYYEKLAAAAAHLQSPLLLAIRLYWGWQLFQTGSGKLGNHEHVTEYFTSLHIPLPGLNAWLVGLTECVGGLFLLAGLLSRVTAIALSILLAVAYLTDPDNLKTVQHIFTEPDKFTAADPFLFLFAAVIVLAFGPGKFSVDALLSRVTRLKLS